MRCNEQWVKKRTVTVKRVPDGHREDECEGRDDARNEAYRTIRQSIFEYLFVFDSDSLYGEKRMLTASLSGDLMRCPLGT